MCKHTIYPSTWRMFGVCFLLTGGNLPPAYAVPMSVTIGTITISDGGKLDQNDGVNNIIDFGFPNGNPAGFITDAATGYQTLGTVNLMGGGAIVGLNPGAEFPSVLNLTNFLAISPAGAKGGTLTVTVENSFAAPPAAQAKGSSFGITVFAANEVGAKMKAGQDKLISVQGFVNNKKIADAIENIASPAVPANPNPAMLLAKQYAPEFKLGQQA